MSRKLIIDPVTRIEGHGKVTVHLDDDNNVVDARLHVVEFRGFEKFVQGHPFWEAPMLMQASAKSASSVTICAGPKRSTT